MDIEKTDSRALSRLLDLDGQFRENWSEDELSAMLKHQLAGPLVIDLELQTADIEDQLSQINTTQETPIETFADVLFHAQAPLALTTLIKEFAKQQRDTEGLTEEIASLLYVAAICAAFRNGDRSISSLDDTSLVNNIQQLLSFPWLDERTHHLFQSTIEALEAGS